MDTLTKLIQQRDEFLEERPHLKEFQRKIDDVMDKCRPEDRYEAVMMMLAESMGKQLRIVKAVERGLSNGLKSV